ncbi:hypothetical protein N656DRAFT_797924 [Canariomyces notabilis]|uniref:Siroheme synthase n=1 Tax=Canariomyces notabilis TaxID=2074819 RepID=A0AAN6TE32_9PEZI|nr:hypothetical protein N656DRAFT_797924 [Canariomyces arenarius]
MPPRRRENRPPPSESPRSSSPDSEHSLDEADSSPLPFYNTTFSAHRVSPLYLGSEPLTANRLQTLAQRLRERLIGDVVRGVEVGLGPDGEDPVMGRAGALESVEMSWVSMAAVLGIFRNLHAAGSDEMDVDVDDDGEDAARLWRALRRKRALHIALQYEMASCTALLLPSLTREGEDNNNSHANAASQQQHTRFSVGADDMDWERSVDPTHFLTLPLLLLRMPAPLKAVIGDFLSVTFDCRVSPMRLGTRSLVRSWEAWIRTAGLPSRGPLAKDAVLSLGFHIPPPQTDKGAPEGSGNEAAVSKDHQIGLKSIDVIIPPSELSKFVSAGRRLAATPKPGASAGWAWEDDLAARRRLAGRLFEEGWEWRATEDGTPSGGDQPFTEALACYLDEHLGLNLFHPGVRVVKIACGGFAMSEGRLKIFSPGDPKTAAALGQRRAVLELLEGLVEKAQVQVPIF